MPRSTNTLRLSKKGRRTQLKRRERSHSNVDRQINTNAKRETV
jgi:hypothetical protein